MKITKVTALCKHHLFLKPLHVITPDRCNNVQAQVPIIEENNNLHAISRKIDSPKPRL
jgi:hypothetical protein